jgi:hypothetical protein
VYQQRSSTLSGAVKKLASHRDHTRFQAIWSKTSESTFGRHAGPEKLSRSALIISVVEPCHRYRRTPKIVVGGASGLSGMVMVL